jgi:hypothetical protein
MMAGSSSYLPRFVGADRYKPDRKNGPYGTVCPD